MVTASRRSKPPSTESTSSPTSICAGKPLTSTPERSHSILEAIATALLKVRDALAHEFEGFERKLRAIARQDENAQRLRTTPDV